MEFRLSIALGIEMDMASLMFLINKQRLFHVEKDFACNQKLVKLSFKHVC